MARPKNTKQQTDRGLRLAKKIRSSRGERATQEQLAQMAGVPLDTLRRLERGVVASPNFFLIADIAVALGEDINEWID